MDAKYSRERRVLFVAPTSRDGVLTCSLLENAGLSCYLCRDNHELAREIIVGAGAVLLTEETLVGREIENVLIAIRNQPAWSDLAVVLLIRSDLLSSVVANTISALNNVTLLERPAPMRSVVSAVQTAVRARERQYQIRDQMESTRRAEETARNLRRELELAIDASQLGTFHCDMPLNKIIWNTQCKRHFWLPPDAEIDFELFYNILHPDDRERTRRAVEACVYGGQSYDIEYRTISPTGQFRWVRATGRTQYNEQGQPIQFDGTTQDITDRKRAEQALKEADQRKDEFLATLAHELRNPLSPIRNSLQLLMLSGELGPALKPICEIMDRQVSLMVRLIDDLLDVSRISTGKLELRKETIELATVISAAIETAQSLIKAAGHHLSLSLPDEPVVLEADPARLTQIISNLLNNAAKYTNPGGQIALTARIRETEAVISVKDNGLGIPAEMLTRVFDLFSQVDRTITRSQGGLGIGLTLTKSLVEMHGGKIAVYSDGLGLGSEFVIHLPLTPKQTSPYTKGSKDKNEPLKLARHRIVIVDDTRAAGFVLGKLLEMLGQEVRIFYDAASAIKNIHLDIPDLVISDIAMPGIDGYEFARQVRKDPALSGLTLAALTGYGQESDRQSAQAAGFDHHLVKPVGLEALQDLLASLPRVTSE